MDNNGLHWLLAELPDITAAVSFPLQCTQRIKYTCLDVSKNLLIFGATSGGLYVFNRDPCNFIQLIPNKEGSIVKIKISPQEKCVAFATHKGFVCVCDCGTDIGTYMRSPILQISKEHQGNEVTSMIWCETGNQLYIGDDTGTVSNLHITKSFAKNVFQSSSLTSALIQLDSRIVQLDIKENLLLVSTLTKCFICDTTKEQYAQIGQKLRDGEFGACFFYQSSDDNHSLQSLEAVSNNEASGKIGKYNILSEEEEFNCSESLNNLKIFCARPGSRLWEVKINGTVTCTHQFKQLLAVAPSDIITSKCFETEDFEIKAQDNNDYSPQSLNFTQLLMLKNQFIFTFRKDGIYIFDTKEPAIVLWSNKYSDIVDCKIVNDFIYLWRSNGYLTTLSFSTVEKFILKCFVNQKYKLCAQICALHASTIIHSIPTSKKIHLISELGNKLQENGEKELLDKVSPVLDEISKVKRSVGLKSKTGIVVVENNFLAKSASCDMDTDSNQDIESPCKTSSDDSESILFQISPDAIQVIKDFSSTVSDKLNLGTKSLKKTWDHIEDTMKKIGLDKTYNEPLNVKNNDTVNNGDNDDPNVIVLEENNILYPNDDENIIDEKNPIIRENNIKKLPKVKPIIETLYNYIKRRDDNRIDSEDSIYRLLSEYSCDIKVIYQIIKELEEYIINFGVESVEFSAYHCAKVLLQYISKNPNLDITIDTVIENEDLCSYFLQGFININSNTNYISSCECGYPLPNMDSSQKPPLFIDILNIFIEKRWKSSQSEQCYDICKKVPYMWRKILLLRNNEDLINLLLLILQMLDEELLYMYLPQFTVQTWEKAVMLLGTLKKYECLNCGKKFDDIYGNDFQKNNLLSWDSIGALMIKSIGCANASHVLKNYAVLIPIDNLSLRFFHSCFFVKLFEKYDGTVVSNLIDTIYRAYDYEDASFEMCKHLKDCFQNGLPHTALPLAVASKSTHWGLKVIKDVKLENESIEIARLDQSLEVQNVFFNLDGTPPIPDKNKRRYAIGMSVEQTLEFIDDICPNKNCHHCCLPLTSRVLVADGGLWVFSCGHTFHGTCLKILQIKLCPLCFKSR